MSARPMRPTRSARHDAPERPSAHRRGLRIGERDGRDDAAARHHRGAVRPLRHRASRAWRHWPAWVSYGAAAWSLGYAALGLYWTLGGAGFPFGVGHDPAPHLSVLGSARRGVVAPLIATLGSLGAVAALTMARGRGRGWRRTALLAFAWTVAAGLALVIPDFRVLVVIAYALILLLGAPFGWPPGVRLPEVIPWPLVNQAVCMAGGMLWAGAAAAYHRRSREACPHCGRRDATGAWTSPSVARRWGRAAVAIAVLVPVVYALTRWAWALGFPLGITERLFREGQATGLWWFGAALGLLAVCGASLTLGLACRWGEIFPRWLPQLAGRRVPPALVIVPASAVAVIVTSAGLMFVRMTVAGTFVLGDHAITLQENWGALAPELLWPIWGVALGAATLAYHLRTRGRCERCGRP